MIKPGQNKPQNLTRGDSERPADREASMRDARLKAESQSPLWDRREACNFPRSPLNERMRALLDRLNTAQHAVSGPPPMRVSFSKIAEWCERTAGVPALQIYRDLLQSYLSGAFERTLVFYLTNLAPDLSDKTGLTGYRMRRSFLEARARVFSADDEKEASVLFEAYLAPCWIYCGPAVRWLENKGYPVPTSWKQAKRPEEPPAVSPKGEQNKRGRKLGYDWEESELFAEKLLDLHGDFAVQENAKEGWRSQADLEELVGDHILEFDKKRPVHSTIRKHIAPVIKAWRNKQAADN